MGEANMWIYLQEKTIDSTQLKIQNRTLQI